MARSPRSGATAVQLNTLSQRAPYVASQRLVRMANPHPSAANRRDLARMGAEKITALQQGWLAMGTELFAQQQQAWLALWQSALTPWTPESPLQWWYRSLVGADAVMAAGLRPATRQVSANARRLSPSHGR